MFWMRLFSSFVYLDTLLLTHFVKINFLICLLIRSEKAISHLQAKVIVELENNDILQICATVIVGALIFLTLVSESTSAVLLGALIIIRLFGLGIMIFFSYAALQAIKGRRDRAIKQMRRGFLFMFAVSSLFVIDQVVSFYLINAQKQPSLPMIDQSNMTMNSK
jgi:hypothetical protein